MKKQDLIDFVAEDVPVTKKDAKVLVESVLKGLRKGLIDDSQVSLVGFGTFSVRVKAAHKGRNPKTGETIDVPEKSQIKFKASADLKESVQQ